MSPDMRAKLMYVECGEMLVLIVECGEWWEGGHGDAHRGGA